MSSSWFIFRSRINLEERFGMGKIQVTSEETFF